MLRRFLKIPSAILLSSAAALAGDFPTFTEKVIDPNVGKVCYAVTIADVDGDKDQDIVALTENRVVWYEQPSWKAHVILQDQTPLDNVCIAPHDIDGDGQVDFAIGAGWTKTGTLHWIRRTADPNALWQVAAIGVMSFAAHVGGELVHEEGFPFKPNKVASPRPDKAAPDVEPGAKRDDYAQVIAPILEAHCVECHGAKKVKGKLRMDSLEALKKGGSEGAAFVAGDLQKSLMHVRVTLDPSDDEFMPTEGNPLTKDQVQAFALFIEGKPIPDDVAKAALAATKAPKRAPKK